MQILPMKQQHIPDLCMIEDSAQIKPWHEQKFLDCLLAGYGGYVLETKDQPVGYGIVSVASDEAEILNLCVHAVHQGKAFGKALLNYLIECAKSKGAKRVFLEVRKSNRNAIHLYRSMGFKRVAVRKDYYATPVHGSREDALVFRCQL